MDFDYLNGFSNVALKKLCKRHRIPKLGTKFNNFAKFGALAKFLKSRTSVNADIVLRTKGSVTSYRKVPRTDI